MKFRSRKLKFTSAHALGVAAIFLALTGGAFAVNGLITSADIQDNTIQGADVRSDNLEDRDLKGGSVGSSELKQDAIGSSRIQAGAVRNSELNSDVVTTDKVADGTLTGDDIADGSVGSADVADGAIGFGKLEPEVANAVPKTQSGRTVTGTVGAGSPLSELALAFVTFPGTDLSECVVTATLRGNQEGVQSLSQDLTLGPQSGTGGSTGFISIYRGYAEDELEVAADTVVVSTFNTTSQPMPRSFDISASC